MVHLAVADEGEGIAPKHMAHVEVPTLVPGQPGIARRPGSASPSSVSSSTHRGHLNIKAASARERPSTSSPSHFHGSVATWLGRSCRSVTKPNTSIDTSARRSADLAFQTAPRLRGCPHRRDEALVLLRGRRLHRHARLDDRGCQRDRGLPSAEAHASTAHVPIVMLTARPRATASAARTWRGQLCDQAVQPARVDGRISRAPQCGPRSAAKQLSYADIEMDVEAHRIRATGRPGGRHSRPSFGCFATFMDVRGRVFSRERLLDAVWGHRPTSTRARSTSTSGGFARRSTNTRAPRHDPHRRLPPATPLDAEVRRCHKSEIRHGDLSPRPSSHTAPRPHWRNA